MDKTKNQRKLSPTTSTESHSFSLDNHSTRQRRTMAQNINIKLDGLDELMVKEILQKESSKHKNNKQTLFLEALHTYYQSKVKNGWRH